MEENTMCSSRMLYICKSLFVVISLLLPGFSKAQNANSPVNSNGMQEEAIRVYFDYSESDNTERFLRSDIHFVTYVRDPNLAQVHVFITEQRTGSGGKKHLVSFIGNENFKDQDQNLIYYSQQSATDIERREGLSRIIKMGLMPYVAQTALAEQLDIQYDDKKEKSISESLEDPWDFWIFSIDLGGGMNAEESVKGYTLISSIDADRVTEIWKIQNSFELMYEEEQFSNDEEDLISTLRTWEASSEIIRSLSARWSTGIFGSMYSTTYKNIRLGYDIGTGIEFNIFPWPEAERRLITLGYYIGYKQDKYRQLTIYNKFRQSLWFQSLILEMQMAQPWGEIDLEVEGRQYPELKDNYSIQLDLELSVRLSSAWAIYLETNFESIHDQIFLPRGDASIDEVLLKRRQLATTYDLRATFGLSFTFGSIYNNIINRRM
jgi:hypothetical protein